jgi:hypothetical protein
MKGKLARTVTHREFLKMCGLAIVGAGAAQVVTPSQPVLAADGNFDNLYVTGIAGVGTASPGAKLHVYSNDTTKTLRLEGGPSFNARLLEGFVNSDERFYIDFFGDLYFSQGGFASVKNASAGGVVIQNSIHVTNLGNVGIGTSAPDQKLQVAGNIRINGEVWVNSAKAIDSAGVATQCYYAQ